LTVCDLIIYVQVSIYREPITAEVTI